MQLKLTRWFIALVLGSTISLHAQDVVLATNVIVQGSLAVGLDAVNGENFGFDTIRIKENNTRIHFQDTSAGIDPGNDWRLIANDAFNGGGNYLAIEDGDTGNLVLRVDAGAPADSLRVASSGWMGVQTTNPMAVLHVNVSAGSGDGVIIGPSGTVLSNNVLLHVAGKAFLAENLEVGSSRDSKTDIQPLEPEQAMQTLLALEPVHYRYLNQSEPELGFIAEDVPDLVATESRSSLSPMDFIAVLTGAVQAHEQQEQNLREEIERQDTRIREALLRLERLENRVHGGEE